MYLHRRALDIFEAFDRDAEYFRELVQVDRAAVDVVVEHMYQWA